MIIEIKNIVKKFGKKTVLDGVSLTAESGKCIGILGENGSGKSTLFSVLTGIQHGKGEFLCDGIDLMNDTSLRNKKVGFVPQSPPLLGELTSKDNLRLWYSKEQMEKELKDGRLSMLGINNFLNVAVNKHSGGMKKRLAIGCAIAHNPQILLLDEPCSALDIVCKEKIYEYLSGFIKVGGIVIIATHDIYELSLCDDIYFLKDGRLSLYDGDRRLESLVRQLNHD